MTEYWLQKKTIGGWSMVTWYGDLEQAMTNYKKCIGNGNSGYSWRLCKVEAIETSMLEEVVEIEPISDEAIIAASHRPDGYQPLPMKTSWGADIQKPKSNGWGEQNVNTSSWSNTWDKSKFAGNVNLDIPSDSSKPEHGLTGSVWVVNHALKEKKRVPASEVDNMLALGYERGGPKTKFRE